jgi:beta-lactam-binding protein with PASTA domain
VFQRITVVIAIALAFLFGLATTVYLSLRSPEVTVPNVLGRDRFEAENILGKAGLNFRVRATRPSNQVKSDTVLFQLPRAGEVVKTGQTVAMDISRATKEGESSVTPPTVEEEKKSETANTNSNENKQARSKNTNKNANENGNANSNRTANANTNATRPRLSANSNVSAKTNANTQPAAEGVKVDKAEAGKTTNDAGKTPSPDTHVDNSNKRPAPKPSPTERNNNRDNR